MYGFSEQEEALREESEKRGEPFIARKWSSSRFIYEDGDSKRRVRNPEYHPPICQTEDGDYVNEDGHPIPEDQIPQYILEQGAPPDHTPERGSRELKLSEVMQGALDRDPKPAKRGRPKKVK